jgi:Secretion system C-terminal sorting domain
MNKLLFLFLIAANIIFSQTQYRFYINNINLPLNNRGVLAAVNIPDPDPFISGAGGKIDNKVFLFSGGFFMSGYNGDSLWSNGVSSASLVEDYLPGLVGSSPTDPKNKIYVVDKNDAAFSQSWLDWKDATDYLLAGFYDGDGDAVYNPVDKNGNGQWDLDEDKPDLLGDKTAWCVYNDGVPATQRRFNDVNPLGIEIRQTVFAYDSLNPTYPELKNTIFIRYQIKNTGLIANVLDSVIFSLWSDHDIGFASDDLIGTDTLVNSVFGYNEGDDMEFGVNPPSLFLTYMQLPPAYIPNETFIDNNGNGLFDEGIDTPLDTAYYYRGPDLGIQEFPGAKNIEMATASGYMNSDPITGDAQNKSELRNYLSGKLKSGEILNPCNWVYTSIFGNVNCPDINPYYWASGDPTIPYGWLWTTTGDLRMMGNSAKFKLVMNESVEIIVAYTASRGTDAQNSITLTKSKVNYAIGHYKTNFSQIPVSVKGENSTIPVEFILFQNYPNPFNPSTKISWQSPVSSHQTLKVYDVLGNEVATLVDEYKPAGIYNVQFTMNNLASGIYFYRLQAGSFVQIKKMILLK